jgi:hypothetical protein
MNKRIRKKRAPFTAAELSAHTRRWQMAAFGHLHNRRRLAKERRESERVPHFRNEQRHELGDGWTLREYDYVTRGKVQWRQMELSLRVGDKLRFVSGGFSSWMGAAYGAESREHVLADMHRKLAAYAAAALGIEVRP